MKRKNNDRVQEITTEGAGNIEEKDETKSTKDSRR